MKKAGLLNKILWQGQPRLQLIAGSVAFVLGLLVLLLAWQFYQDVSTYLSGGEKAQHYLTINKKSEPGQHFVHVQFQFPGRRVGRLKSTTLYRGGGALPEQPIQASIFTDQEINFYTYMFFESLPADFLDEVPEGWSDWSSEDPVVPIIISREFLNLYNFGFAFPGACPSSPSPVSRW